MIQKAYLKYMIYKDNLLKSLTNIVYLSLSFCLRNFYCDPPIQCLSMKTAKNWKNISTLNRSNFTPHIVLHGVRDQDDTATCATIQEPIPELWNQQATLKPTEARKIVTASNDHKFQLKASIRNVNSCGSMRCTRLLPVICQTRNVSYVLERILFFIKALTHSTIVCCTRCAIVPCQTFGNINYVCGGDWSWRGFRDHLDSWASEFAALKNVHDIFLSMFLLII